ncbi:CDP-alcohol phosphatidyltransferase family protein [Leifsonia sp. 2TAF2]|uniref:CDP-alcohol phosphatidyltransferase family protein n=1 Tax=Leifsonia sp. 2TAF2 TaxID=3233009 RepID=UPI003F999080
MERVHIEATGWAAGGGALALAGQALAVATGAAPPTVAGWAALAAYLSTSTALLLHGLVRRRAARFGAANIVTALRSSLVGLIFALVIASFSGLLDAGFLTSVVVPALALDAVDGWVARRTGSVSELGARFDMEVDAFLLLVLSVFVARTLGPWVLAIGLLRYAFVAAGWMLPWLNRTLPARYWRKVVTAVAGIALALAASGAAPVAATLLVILALALLVESFGRDVIWLFRRRHDAALVQRTAELQRPL